jgi:protein-disulfide isomerase
MVFRSRIALCALMLIFASASVDAQKQTDAKEATVPAVSSGQDQPHNSTQSSQSPGIDLGELVRSIAAFGEPFRGARDAKVTIVFFDDYQCPYCEQMYKVLFNEVMPDYGSRVKVFLKDVPNSMIHPWAKRAAINARCLAAQDTEAYWDFTDQVHLDQRQIGNEAKLDEIAIGAAQKRNADLTKVKACLQEQPNAAVTEGYRVAYGLGITAVPLIFVNEERVFGAVDAQVLGGAIDRALARVGEKPVPVQQTSSVPPQDFSKTN